MHPHKLDVEKALDFITAGRAIVTFKSVKTGTRFTYKVSVSKKNEKILFVGLLNGNDNLNDYAPMCYIRLDDCKLPTILKSTKTWISEDAQSYKAFKYVFNNLVLGIEMKGLEIWHEGRCCRCGKLLTVPESIENGIGPECIKKERKIAI